MTETASDFATGNPNMHGYTTLGLLAGTFDPGAVLNTLADEVTGTWPGGDLPFRAIDLSISIANSTLDDRILQALQAISGDVVISTSLAAGCAPTGCTQQEIDRDARDWITRVRASGLEDRFVHVVAAGNIYPTLPNDKSALLGSYYIAAAMTNPGGLAHLTNTISVENTTSSDGSSEPVAPLCMTNTSKEGGHISAVGNDIKSLSAPGQPRDLPLGGTSSAAPQAAGAAAMVWALDNSLSPSEVVNLLIHTARPMTANTDDPRCKNVKPAPALDEYAAVLGVDTAVTQPVRSTILDVADSNDTLGAPDGTFDEHDVDAIVGELAAGAGAIDYGRFDLNGDGRTGGGTSRFDLDGVRPVAWNYSARRDMHGLKVLHDETAVRDVDVLCHEAAGPRYTGDLTARDVFLEQRCLPPVEIDADPPFPATVQPGVSTPLRIVAKRPDIADPIAAEQPGVRLELSATGGTVANTTGLTGADGSFTTSATLVSPASRLDVTIIARAGLGGRELDRITVSATPGTGPITVGDGYAFLVANAEADDDVKEFFDPNFSDSVSAADKDATASGIGSSSLQVTSTGMEFSGSGNISATDDGGGGDASVYIDRDFTFADAMPYKLVVSLAGNGFANGETTGRVQISVPSGTNPSGAPRPAR